MEPLCEAHLEALWRHVSPELFQYMNFWWWGSSLEEFSDVARAIIARPDLMTFAMVLAETGEPVGSSAYLDIRPEHRALEIGATWISPAYQATFVNPSAKLLMLSHAFEELGCIRVQFKTDARNVQSLGAMEKLGCKKEGVLRKHVICRDGYIRDSVFYSIVDSEWPEVKAGLLERLAGRTPSGAPARKPQSTDEGEWEGVRI